MPPNEDAHTERLRAIYSHMDESAGAAPAWSTIPKSTEAATHQRWPGPLVAVGVATVTLIVVGLTALLLGSSGPEVPPAASDDAGIGTTSTTVVPSLGFDCPVTIPPLPGFTPPEGYHPHPVFGVWYGTDDLWTVLEVDGSHAPRKTVFWSANFPGGGLENLPEVHVTWTRLDSDEPPISNDGKATNANTSEDGDFMIAGLDPEEPGCWEVTATYKQNTLTYVYEVPIGGYAADSPLFSEYIPWVLLFDDGLDGLIAVDPDLKTAARVRIEGQRAGDQPYRLGLTDGHLIVGWGGVSSVPLDDFNSILLGDATVWLPAAEAGHVWLVDYPGGRIGEGIPSVSYESVTSRLVFGPTRIETDGVPAIGIQGGLAFETDAGVVLWYSAGDNQVTTLGTDHAFVSDVSRDRSNLLAWCEGSCSQMHVTDLDDGSDTVFEHPVPGRQFDARSARFSATRRHLAATAGPDIVIMDTDSGDVYVAASTGTRTGPPFLAWAPFGAELYASSNSYGGIPTTTIVRILVDPVVGTAESVTLPFGGAMQLIVASRSEAGGLVGRPAGRTPPDCPPTLPTVGEGTGPCTFGF